MRIINILWMIAAIVNVVIGFITSDIAYALISAALVIALILLYDSEKELRNMKGNGKE